MNQTPDVRMMILRKTGDGKDRIESTSSVFIVFNCMQERTVFFTTGHYQAV